MGVHTGDSITVAPAQTLTDKEYQIMRDASIAVLREIGVDTGGSNVQFAINPTDGRMVVIEMNPRVSRSSALASKATGFPIAKIAAKLAVGYTLDELRNDITGGATPASFEPTIDYVVTKVPRFAFEKFPQADDRLTTQMKSVGEVMAIGRTFQESFQKALRGLEIGVDGLNQTHARPRDASSSELGEPGPERIWYVGDAFEIGFTLEEVLPPHADRSVVPRPDRGDRRARDGARRPAARRPRRDDAARAQAQGLLRPAPRLPASTPTRRRCASSATRSASARSTSASTPAPPSSRRNTAYMYSTYEDECEAAADRPQEDHGARRRANRIGQGIEFDYCCVHAALALREDGFETIMVNCNPETVSTDYDTSDRLYFEPLTLEDVLEIVDLEKPLGRDRAVRRPDAAQARARPRGAPACRSSAPAPTSIDVAEDRERFQQLLHEARAAPAAQPHRAHRATRRSKRAEEIGYPVVVRPSYVLGGRAMEIVHEQTRPRALHARSGEGVERFAGAARPLPRTTRSRSTSTASATATTC